MYSASVCQSWIMSIELATKVIATNELISESWMKLDTIADFFTKSTKEKQTSAQCRNVYDLLVRVRNTQAPALSTIVDVRNNNKRCK